MEKKIVLVDTSILIDYYRKTDKNKTVWISLINQGFLFAISAITKYEINTGATHNQLAFWNNVFKTTTILSFDQDCADKAVEINAHLKVKRKQIAIPDLFIAATALTHNLPLATLNIKHFERIDTLQILK